MADLYQRKGQVVEANRLDKNNGEAIALWCGGQYFESASPFASEEKYAEINFHSPDGPARASEGDYIVKTPSEEFRSMSEYEFLRNYEPVLNKQL